MFVYEKKLQYPVNIKNTNPKLASLIISQYGGPYIIKLSSKSLDLWSSSYSILASCSQFLDYLSYLPILGPYRTILIRFLACFALFPHILSRGDQMKYEDPKMEAYFKSLPGAVQNYINQSGIDICSLGDLTLIGEHFTTNQRDDTSATNQNS